MGQSITSIRVVSVSTELILIKSNETKIMDLGFEISLSLFIKIIKNTQLIIIPIIMIIM